jgi:uncharacterized oligopeptide transporter (OPT) family protein
MASTSWASMETIPDQGNPAPREREHPGEMIATAQTVFRMLRAIVGMAVVAAGIAMLLPLEASIAIFLGGMIKWVAMLVASRDKQGEVREQALNQSNDDTMLIGSALFASSAIMTVLMIIVMELSKVVFGTPWFYLG